jgi:hypothetical protein
VVYDAVDDLDQVLSATNQVREEFRKNFPFPLVLWISEDVHNKLIELAPDFESWATTTRFAIATDALIDYLQRKTDSLFTQCLKLGDMGSVFWPNDALCGAGYSREIHTALRDLQNIGQDLEPSLQASVEFARGRDAHASDEIDAALKHYQQTLDVWQHPVDNPQRHNSISQTPNPQLRKGVVLYYIGLVLYPEPQGYFFRFHIPSFTSVNSISIHSHFTELGFTLLG